jgi:hydrogenase/urease accessory protein HupE
MNRRSGERWVAVAASVEVVTALVLVIRASLFGGLLFGAELSDAGQALGRLAGFALLALALACWPTRGTTSGPVPALPALLVFGLLTTIYLVYLGFGSELVGPLLGPVPAMRH